MSRFPTWPARVSLVACVLLASCRTAPPGAPLSRSDVVSLSQEGFAPEVLGLAGRHSGLDFTMTPDTILGLYEQGLSAEEVEALLAASAERRDQVEGRRANLLRGVGRWVPTVGRIAVGLF